MIDLYYHSTPNSTKVTILLEELKVPYRLIKIDLRTDMDHLKPEFGKINPNRKVPVMVDNAPGEGLPPIKIYESGAILLYLAEKFGKLIPQDAAGHYEVVQWLFWQMANLGPMSGQAHHFLRYVGKHNTGEEQTYGRNRYLNETRRLLSIMDERLSEVDYLVGEYSIADIACWPWVDIDQILGIDLAGYPAVKRWADKISAREAVRRAVDRDADERDYPEKVEMTAEQWESAFGRGYHAKFGNRTA